MEGPPEVSELIYKCAKSIKSSPTDTEKLAGLYVAAQALKKIDDDSLKRASKSVLLESIGPRFLVRLLSSKDSPEYRMFQSVAFSVLNAFALEKDLSVHPFVLAAVPQVVNEIVEMIASEREDRVILGEAFDFILAVALNNEGRDVLDKCNALNRIVRATKGRSTELALSLISSLIHSSRQVDYTLLHELLNKAVSELSVDNTQRKFDLCAVLNNLLVNCDRAALISSKEATAGWPKKMRGIVSRILSSRLGENQRNPTLKLASTMIEIFGTDWALAPGDMDKPFFLLLAHLSAVEVRMQLEDRTLEVILKNADLIIACFVILEMSLSYVSTDCSVLTEDETNYLLKVAQESLLSVVEIYKQMGNTRRENSENAFKLALARVIVAWLAHEANSRLPEVQHILPSLIKMASDSFFAYTYWMDSGKALEKRPIDLLRLLLPGLCHVSAEPEGRKIFKDLEIEKVLFHCFTFHWKCARGMDQEGYTEDSETALITLSNVFLNLYIQVESDEGSRGPNSGFHLGLLEFIVAHLKDTSSTSPLLTGHLIVLGLVLVQHSPKAVKFKDLEAFFQISMDFLKGMFTLEGNRLMISSSFCTNSDQLLELWTISLTVLSSILHSFPELSELITDSRWIESLIDSLLAQNLDDAPPNFTVQVENLICSLLQSVPRERFQDSNTLAACRRHNLKQLGCTLFPSEFSS